MTDRQAMVGEMIELADRLSDDGQSTLAQRIHGWARRLDALSVSPPTRYQRMDDAELSAINPDFARENPNWRATASAVSPGGWQPIGTAPKDGTKIVLLGALRNDDGPNHPHRLRACVSAWISDHSKSPAWIEGWYFTAPGFSGAFDPTHWQPLPPPPADALEPPR